MSKKYLIVGAGFSGAVLAHQLCKNVDCTIATLHQLKEMGVSLSIDDVFRIINIHPKYY